MGLSGQCALIFLRYHRCPPSGIICAAADLANELRNLDYSPVMDVFLERGLDRVSYEHEHDSFVFTFTNPVSGLKFSRRDHTWNAIDPSGVNIRKRLEVIHSLATAGSLKDGDIFTFRTVAELERFISSGVIAGSPFGAMDSCTSCGNAFQHPPNNPKLINCPRCGAPYSLFASNQAQASNTIPAGALPSPAAPGSLIPDLRGYTISMRCPGGCGSMIEAIDFMGAKTTTITSPCKYRCRVKPGVWDKKLAEAKKNQPR